MARWVQDLTWTFMIIVFTAAVAWGQPRYIVTDLGAFQPNAIAGPWVVGQESGVPVRLNLDTGREEPLAAPSGGVVEDVNAQGWAIGTTKAPSQGTLVDVATVWGPDGSMTFLSGPLPSFGMAINDRLTMAGRSGSCPTGQQAVRWYADGRWECLTGDYSYSSGSGVDAADRVWGNSSNVVHVWEPGTTHGYALLDEGGVQSGITGGNGVVMCGVSPRGTTPAAAHFHWPPAISLLPPLPVPDFPLSAVACFAHDVNAQGATVGQCHRRHAVLWPDAATVVELSPLVTPATALREAVGINDDGEIIALAADGRGVLLTPLPEVAVESAGPEGIAVRVTSNGEPLPNMPVYGGLVDGLQWQWRPIAVGHTDASGRAVLPPPIPADMPGTHHALIATWAGGQGHAAPWVSYSVPFHSIAPVLVPSGRTSMVAHVLANGQYGVPNVPTWGGAFDAQGHLMATFTVAPTDSQGRRILTAPEGTHAVTVGTWWGDASVTLQPQVASR